MAEVDRWWCYTCRKIVTDVKEYSSARGYKHVGCGNWSAEHIPESLSDELKAEGAAKEREACEIVAEEAIRSYRTQYQVDDVNDGLLLVDILGPVDAETIGLGKAELDALIDEVCGAIRSRGQQPKEESGE